MQAHIIQDKLERLGNPQIASHSQRFFKTGPGQYGEGDVFRGIRVPELRKLARDFKDLPFPEIDCLLHSAYHEDRLTAVLIMVEKYKRGTESDKQALFDLYLQRTEQVNNWDLVDSSAHLIVGPHLQPHDRQLLDKLAGSHILWERRIAIIATFHYIKQREYDDALRISDHLLNDTEDLIHKAVGWMLREIGKRDFPVEELFLKPRYQRMPRTMLRYAIEKFPEPLRKKYLAGTV